MSADRSFSAWCAEIESVLGRDLPNEDGYDPSGPTVHDLFVDYEAGKEPAEIADRIKAETEADS